MQYFAVFTVALVIVMVSIPLLMRFANRLKLVDMPGERKVHTNTVPRVGGIGMVFSIIITVIYWVGYDATVMALLYGIGVIFIFGVWDDRGDLDYRLKFLGQVIAAIIVVVYGDIAIKVVPFFGLEPVSPWFYYPLTLFFLVAVTNAINLADGLDGLAAGVVLLSLAGVAILAFLAAGNDLLLITMALIGSIMGFLRFNTYPARIFMGDTGSQFLGFTTGVLMILLTQQVNSALNPAVPFLLLGLPLFDTMFVMVRRIYRGKSPFSPDKNHAHHQLLALNFNHYEAVIIIYFVHTLFVVSGILLRYQSDLLVISTWLLVNIVLATVLVFLGKASWRAHDNPDDSILARLASTEYKSRIFTVSYYFLMAGVCLLLLLGPLLVAHVDSDLGVLATILGVLLLLRLLFVNRLRFISLRLILYIAIACVVYLVDLWLSDIDAPVNYYDYLYYGAISFALVVGARYKIEDAFKITPTDFLVLLLVVGSLMVPQLYAGSEGAIPLTVKLVVMFYAVEVLLYKIESRWSLMTLTALWALGVISIKSFGLV